jgi:hypothetical protein
MNDDEIQNLEHWFEQTQNPLHAWEALARCLAPDAPEQRLPDFVREYFRDAAVRMSSLSIGRHWEDDSLVDPKDAPRLVGEALELWRERSKNAFVRRRDDGDNGRAAFLADVFKTPTGQQPIGGRSQSSRQATRRIAAGRKLNRRVRQN